MLIALGLIALVGSLVVYGISYTNYDPLRRLKAFTDERAGSTTETDEIASVKRSVEHLYATSRLISKRLEDSRTAIKDALLRDLVNGRLTDPAEFERRAGDFDLPPLTGLFVVSVFRIEEAAGKTNQGGYGLIEEVERLLSPYFSVLGGVGDVKGNLPTFVFFLREGDFDMLDGLLLEVHERLVTKGFPPVFVGVGDPRSSPADARQSYDEAVKAADYRLTGFGTKVIFFAAIADRADELVRYPKELTERLRDSLMHMDLEKAGTILGEIIAFMEKNKMPLFLARIACFDIITTIVKTIENLDHSGGVWRNERRDIERLMNFETVAELASAVRELLGESFAQIRKGRALRADERVDSFRAYVRENFKDKNFSVYLMADHFNMSVSSLSHYFKTRTGESISDFVNALRIEEAKRFLRETDLPVQIIVAKLGYLNVSSFIRKFRQETGFTPGMFREKETP